MKLLVIGNGAREHALAWKLSKSPKLTELLVAPGNGGTHQIAENVPIDVEDITGLLDLAIQRDIDLTVVGPEVPLAKGISDIFADAGLLVFGPTREAARIESSKSYAKTLMAKNSIPCMKAMTFSDYQTAREYVMKASTPIVIKADGLAAGKGVSISKTTEDALEALHRSMVQKQFGIAGETVLIEDYMEGPELSVFGFVDGKNISPLVAACDYKRVGNNDTGPNTGGMGSYSPPIDTIWNQEIEKQVKVQIMEPIVKALNDANSPYQGILYAGIMITEEGLKVIEFNCRFGDPETQVILPRLETDLIEVMMSVAQGDISRVNLSWNEQACVGIVLASGGYPGKFETGFHIQNIELLTEEINIFHHGTKIGHIQDKHQQSVFTDGGRVLTLTAMGKSIDIARSIVYKYAPQICFENSFYRTDIASLPKTPFTTKSE